MYTLFGFKGSGSAAVECALEMTGADYRIVPRGHGGHRATSGPVAAEDPGDRGAP